jgi:hypothetical protein
MLYTFKDADGKELGKVSGTLKEAKAFAKEKEIPWVTMDVSVTEGAAPVDTVKKKVTKTPAKPTQVKTRKEWDYFIFDTTDANMGKGLTGPLSRADFDTAIEAVPDLTTIKAFTGRELKLSRKTIVH